MVVLVTGMRRVSARRGMRKMRRMREVDRREVEVGRGIEVSGRNDAATDGDALCGAER